MYIWLHFLLCSGICIACLCLRSVQTNRGDVAGALTLVLSDYPYGPNVEEAKVSILLLFAQPPSHVRQGCSAGYWAKEKDLHSNRPQHPSSISSPMAVRQHVTLQSLLEIVNSTKSTDISNAVKSISIDQRDALMKYLYKGLELGGEGEGVNCAVLLGWHERVSLSRHSSPPLSLACLRKDP